MGGKKNTVSFARAKASTFERPTPLKSSSEKLPQNYFKIVKRIFVRISNFSKQNNNFFFTNELHF